MINRSYRSFLGLSLVTAALVAAVSGCSGGGIKKVTVSGTVSYKGQKLQSGILKFIGPEGAYSAASIQPDGTYIITDVVPGETKVGVMESPSGSGSSSSPNERPKTAPKAPPVSLPDKFREPETSGVVVTITGDATDFHIELK